MDRTAVLRGSLLLAVAHAVTDSYTAFLAPLLPRLMAEFGLSVAAAATLSAALGLSSSLPQPWFGTRSDRGGRHRFIALGPLCGVAICLIGVAPSVGILSLLLVLGGLGSAAFHPSGAARAALGGGPAAVSSGRGFSVFSFAGAVGAAMGPVIAVGLVGRFGMDLLWVAMIPGVAIALLILRGGDEVPPPRGPGGDRRTRDLLAALRGPLGLLFGISAVTAFAQRLFQTLEPIAMSQAGHGEALGAAALSTYMAFQAVGTLLSGWLADRVDRRRLLIAVVAIDLPVHAFALLLPPSTPLWWGSIALAGAASMAVLPPIILLAQRLLAGGAGGSSGVVMGLAWAAGTLGLPLVGLVGNRIGAGPAALLALPALALGIWLALRPSLAESGPGHGGIPL